MYTTIIEHIELDREQRSVRKDGQEIHLTGLEYGLLEFLSAHPNRICSRQMVLDHVWGDRFQYDTGTIDVHLNALRRKLGWTKKEPIETVRGIGFIFHIEQKVAHYTIDLQTFLTSNNVDELFVYTDYAHTDEQLKRVISDSEKMGIRVNVRINLDLLKE